MGAVALWGVWLVPARSPLEFLLHAQQRFGDVFRFRMGPLNVHFLFHPDHIRRVLQDEQKNYHVTHRHPGIWSNPDQFDPDRFRPEAVAARSKCAYFPFLSGPHQCIGNEFALLEMRLIVAMMLQAFELELLPGQVIRPKATLTIRPHTPILMGLRNMNSL
jgi:cytochrome P450